MADLTTKPKPKGETTASCLGHPMRCRILEVVNEHHMSPVEFVRRGLAGIGWRDENHALSQVAYHFRVLEKAGAIELLEKNQRRGATEHVYRGRARTHFTSEEFEKLSLAKRTGLTKASVQGFFARTDSAVTTGTFDKRTNRHLSWQAMDLDQKGFTEMGLLLDATLAQAQEILERASDRLANPDPSGEIPMALVERIPTTLGLFAYESPALPPLE